jgi:transglutaminase-like putative cysteine protease
MYFRIRHTTSFDYDGPVYQSQNEVRIHPRDSATQRCTQFELQIDPPAAVLDYPDYYGNLVHAFSIYPPHNSLTVTASSIVERLPESPLPMQRITIEEFLLQDAIRSRAEYDFLNASRHVPFSPPMRKFFWLSRPEPDEDVTAYATRINESIRQQFEYEPGRTRVHSTADEILTVGGGVCQDFAHLAIGILRLAGIPARYVSGYLAPPADARVETIGAQASHAWLEAQLPSLGWTGFDPTHGCRVDDRHIRLAYGRDYSDVPPLRGVYRSTSQKQIMTVELKVEPAPDIDHGPSSASSSQSQQ